MSWQLATFAGLALVVAGGFAWYERSRPPARLVALVAALAALAVAGRLALAPIPNVVATTDIALITGFALGGPPGFAVGALAAPISNIWLGQGPWTVWQMGAWGACGIAGAWLAMARGRTIGRWGLAFACAAAGLAYGALLDLSTMVNYGGEQSLDRYLALSARGLPFNIAHALGNFAIALAAGPALVRMISRFRTRLEFTWRPAGALAGGLIALVAASGFTGAASVDSPAALAQEKREAKASAATRTWLVRHQNGDGGYAATPGTRSNPAMTGWVMLALESAGRNPLDVRKQGNSPVSYLRERADGLRSIGDLERTILALDGAGLDPRKFGDTNLVEELRDRRDRDGSVNGQVNMTAFYVLAMRAAHAGDLGRSGQWLRRAQNRDGGWGFQRGTPSDADSTGAALQALAAAGSGGNTTAAGVRWLRRTQRSSGGWPLANGGTTNAQSTAWAVQGLVAVGAAGKPLDKGLAYLSRLRTDDGHYRYSASSDQTPIWVTSQVLLALEREPLPIAPVERKPPPSSGDDSGAESSDSESTGSTSSGGTSSGYSGSTTPSYGDTSGWGSTTPLGDTDSFGETDSFGGGDTFGGGSIGGSATDSGADSGGGTAADAGAGATSPSLFQALLDEALRNGAEEQAAAEEGAEPVAEAEADTEYAPAATVEEQPVTPFVAAGFAALVVALGAGFVWYRRRLP